MTARDQYIAGAGATEIAGFETGIGLCDRFVRSRREEECCDDEGGCCLLLLPSCLLLSINNYSHPFLN